jgi:hypothetical protein
MENQLMVINIDCFTETNVTTYTVLKMLRVLVLGILCCSTCWYYSVDHTYLV